jgi:hypothetical protein
MDQYIKTSEGFVSIRSILEADNGILVIVMAGILRSATVKPGADAQVLSRAMKVGKWIDLGARRALNPDAFAGAMTNGDVLEFYLAGNAPSLEDKYRFRGDTATKIIAELSRSNDTP